MKPLLTGETVKWRGAFYYHYYGVVGAPRGANWIAYHEIIGVRTAAAKLIYYPTWKNGPFWEYFDLTQDPREMRNLYHDPQRQKRGCRPQRQIASTRRPLSGRRSGKVSRYGRQEITAGRP